MRPSGSGYRVDVDDATLDQCVRLILHGVPPGATWRDDLLPIAVDVDGVVASTLFVRRAADGALWRQEWVLERAEGRWFILGGGGVDDGRELLSTRRTATELGHVGLGQSWGSVYDGPSAQGRFGYICHASLATARNVTTAVLSAGGRRITAPEHGNMTIVWTSATSALIPPEVLLLDATDTPLGTVDYIP
jgi:hypothetical protein